LITNINSRMSRSISIFGGYVLNFAKSNTDGAQNFPANQYDLASEYGRASNDIRNRLFLGGSVVTRWNFRLSPFIIANSGAPFNIVVGRDLYGDTLLGTARPAFAGPNASSVIPTAYGALDPNPQPGERLVPRNYGNGPAFFTVNLRLGRTFGFGGERNSAAASPSGGGGGDRGGDHGPGGGGGGPRGGGGGRGGPGGMTMGGGGRGGPGGMFGGDGGGTPQRYNLSLSINARNLLNTNNAGRPIGDITSPLFGRSNQLAGGFGPEASPANNRRIEMQIRFQF
jgi:hypothetical protein